MISVQEYLIKPQVDYFLNCIFFKPLYKPSLIPNKATDNIFSYYSHRNNKIISPAAG